MKQATIESTKRVNTLEIDSTECTCHNDDAHFLRPPTPPDKCPEQSSARSIIPPLEQPGLRFLDNKATHTKTLPHDERDVSDDDDDCSDWDSSSTDSDDWNESLSSVGSDNSPHCLLRSKEEGSLLVDIGEGSSLTDRRKVHFGDVQIQEYNVTLGDHPCVDQFPISLDWDHTSVLTMKLSDYEGSRLQRISSKCHRRRGPHVLSPMERRMRLSIVAGISAADLQQREQERLEQQCMERLQALDSVDDFDYYEDEDDGVAEDTSLSEKQWFSDLEIDTYDYYDIDYDDDESILDDEEENDENFNGTVDVLSNNTHFDTDGKERGMFSGYRAGTAI